MELTLPQKCLRSCQVQILSSRPESMRPVSGQTIELLQDEDITTQVCSVLLSEIAQVHSMPTLGLATTAGGGQCHYETSHVTPGSVFTYDGNCTPMLPLS